MNKKMTICKAVKKYDHNIEDRCRSFAEATPCGHDYQSRRLFIR